MRDAIAKKCTSALTPVTTAARMLNTIVPIKRVVILGTATGAAVAALRYTAPHSVSAAIAGIGGAATAVAVHVKAWARKYARALGIA